MFLLNWCWRWPWLLLIEVGKTRLRRLLLLVVEPNGPLCLRNLRLWLLLLLLQLRNWLVKVGKVCLKSTILRLLLGGRRLLALWWRLHLLLL